MQVKTKYRMTQIGLIPEEWSILKLGDIVDHTKGFAFKSEDYQSDGVRVIRVSDTTADSIKDANAIYIDSRKAKSYSPWMLKEHDLILSTVGSKPPLYESMVGKVIMIAKKNEGTLLNQNAVILRAKDEKPYKQCLLLNIFRTKRYLNHIEAIFRGNANQASITLKDLFDFRLAMPQSDSEQRAIATALSDLDALINSLDRLIAKKRDIKQATMQQLLTSKTRLPGFAGDWYATTLKDCTDCLDNLRVPLNESERAKMRGDYPYCGANGILDFVNNFVIDDDIILIAEDGGYFDEYAYRPIAYRMSGKCWVNNHAHILKAKAEFDQNFIYYSLVHKNILRFLASGTRAKLNKSELNKIEILLPKDRNEQAAISAILSSLDADLALLEQRCDKTKLLKQGMMQELLTGRTRLV